KAQVAVMHDDAVHVEGVRPEERLKRVDHLRLDLELRAGRLRHVDLKVVAQGDAARGCILHHVKLPDGDGDEVGDRKSTRLNSSTRFRPSKSRLRPGTTTPSTSKG